MRKKILLVDDNKHLLGLLRLNLKGQGFTIATAADGIDAIQKAVTLAPDLILLDLMLPGLDGFAVCESGGSDFVTKPVTTKALLSKIRELLDRPSETATPAAAPA